MEIIISGSLKSPKSLYYWGIMFGVYLTATICNFITLQFAVGTASVVSSQQQQKKKVEKHQEEKRRN